MNTEKKKLLFDAAFSCFISYGFSKTSLDDIAKKAGVSRSSIYLLFKNKKDLFISMVENNFEDKLKKIAEIVKAKGSEKDKLKQFFEIWILEVWSKVYNSPHGAELFEIGKEITKEISAKVQRRLSKLLTDVIKKPELAEIATLAVIGFKSDQPSPAVLKARIDLLIELIANR
ncbi:MAG: TetR/AcrR family transcriptional regulator [Nitrospiraceae bacterium]|nr:TetR/AcrR family transcriptional regulator [Nitrospiraceae bacterium]